MTDAAPLPGLICSYAAARDAVLSRRDRAADLLVALEDVDDMGSPPYGAAVALALRCALVALEPKQYERAVKLGLAGRVGPMRFESVVFKDEGFALAMDCEDQRGAEIAFMVPGRSAHGEVYDMLAWVPETGRFASLLGLIGALGFASLESYPPDAPLMVYESLTDWLRADDLGLFIVDPKIAAGELEGVTIAAPDRDAALRLRAKLAPHCTRAPNIVVPKALKAA